MCVCALYSLYDEGLVDGGDIEYVDDDYDNTDDDYRKILRV